MEETLIILITTTYFTPVFIWQVGLTNKFYALVENVGETIICLFKNVFDWFWVGIKKKTFREKIR